MPKIVDHAARRRELLDAAFVVFDAEGYAAVSMRGLARGMGVTTGTLYHYFDGKEALFRELVQQRFEDDLAEATRSVPEHAPAAERLAGLAAWYATHVEHLEGTLRLVLDHTRQSGPDPVVRHVLDGYAEPIAAALGEELAGPAISLLLGLLVQNLLRGESGDLEAHLKVFAGLGS